MSKRRARDEEGEIEMWPKENEPIAQFVRFNCPTNTTLFHGNEVHYFTGSKAIDTLMESKYGAKANDEPRFPTRRSAEEFMQLMLETKMIWRAKKLVAKKKGKKEEGKDVTKSPKMSEPKSKKDKLKEEEEAVEETDADDKNKDDEKTENKKKKVKLEEHYSQIFSDSNDTFVWIYDPTPLYKKLIGVLMIVGAIGCCCFPLWPPIVRQGVYYLSMTGIGFFGVIIGVAILRTILFGLIWLVTKGEHKLWILPNLTEDVGFFESFQPWYSYSRASEEEKKKGDKKKKKEKNSDDESEKKIEETKAVEKEEKEEEEKEGSQVSGSGSDNSEGEEGSSQLSGEEEQIEEEAAAPSTTSEAPRKRRVRKDDGDFVMVNK